MPILDMPLEQLRQYRGRNPKPDDFDAYWERALDEARSVEPAMTLSPAAFQTPFAECFDLRFTGVRGARIYAKLLRPKKRSAKPAPAFVMFHGYAGNSGDWYELLPYAAAGFTVAAMDCRGQGGLSEDVGGVIGNTLKGHIIRGLAGGPDHLLFRHIYLDCVRLTQLVMGMDGVDPDRVGVHGGSQGGGLTLACAALEPRVNRLAPAFPFLADYLRVWEMDLDKNAYEEIREYFRRFDPTHERKDEFFHSLGYIDIQHLAARVRGKVLMLTALLDDICPPSTQFAVYNKLTAEKEMAVYPDFGHEFLPGARDRIFQFMMEMLD